MTGRLAETFDHLLRDQAPNLFRLHADPFVTQACYCLGEYVRTIRADCVTYQTFLANSFDEALAGAIKLARHTAPADDRPAEGLVIDPDGRLGHFAGQEIDGGGRIEFVPGLTVVGPGGRPADVVAHAAGRFGFVILFDPFVPDALRPLLRGQNSLVIACVDRNDVRRWRTGPKPDIVVFDETFVDREVPFAAFTAPVEQFAAWNRRGKTTFHSTTFQPNAVASLHFLRCLESADPVFYATNEPVLKRIQSDSDYRRRMFGRQYSPFLARAIGLLGFHHERVTARGSYVSTDGRQIFDAVAGVACSMRGHNPASYVSDVGRYANVSDPHAAVGSRLRDLTGLENLLPAVSGATAVENALRLGLAAKFPKTTILALRGGFAGKTLLALAGTARDSYKENLDPLYPDVVYVDPFAPHAVPWIEATLQQHSVAVVQIELIQAVGGVRAVPDSVLKCLQANRRRHDYLLFVDEIQTGMYRTGPFVRCTELGVPPDLLSVGKGTSDMMFPFALTLYSEAVREAATEAARDLPAALRAKYDYAWGFRTVLNVLDWAEANNLADKVRECGALFHRLLAESLESCPTVRSVRVHGLLIGIELNTTHRPRRWLRKGATWLVILNLLRNRTFPLLVGFCQYETNVLKLTPPLTITPEEVRAACDTLTSVLRRPLWKLLPAAARAVIAAGTS
jgi:acetylornithine/succinyldiaminopimelate/putrescine aminotransferase